MDSITGTNPTKQYQKTIREHLPSYCKGVVVWFAVYRTWFTYCFSLVTFTGYSLQACRKASFHTDSWKESLLNMDFQAKLLFPFLILSTFHSYRFIFYCPSVLGLPYFCCCSSHFVHPVPNLSNWFCKYFRHELASILIVYYSRIFFFHKYDNYAKIKPDNSKLCL